MSSVHIGTSGWNYDDWTPDVYPPGLPKAKRRDVYATQFDSVELNASFYHWPKPTSFTLWNQALPAGFRMTVKAPKALTHTGRLATIDEWRETLAESWQLLGERAGLLLVQLPPSLAQDIPLLDTFLTRLPDEIPAAVEFRHDSWHDDQTCAVLREHGAAYVAMHGPKLPTHLWATAPFTYLRFHGPDPRKMYVGEYGPEKLEPFAEAARSWLDEGREVWAYFNNDYDACGVRDARALRSMLDGSDGPATGIDAV